ncbi:MAG: hypothetical protein WAO58_07660 [Fimbriimonadaceae bacterium]
MHVNKRIIFDDKQKPVEVVIAFDEWLKIEELLENGSKLKAASMADLMRFSGTVKSFGDGLEYQHQIRSEWD